MKKILMYVVAFVVGIVIAAVMAMVIDNKYYVDQYDFGDGYKITIDWNRTMDTEYEYVVYYQGCINNGTETQFWWTDASTWYKWLYEHDENYENYKMKKTVWRW